MWKAKKEFLWYKPEDIINEEDLIHIESYKEKDLVYEEGSKQEQPKPVKSKKVLWDLDGDGDFDTDDLKIAAKTLGRFRKAKKK